MPCLPHDPSIYIEASTIEDWVEEFSQRLRANRALKPSLDRAIGNRWYDFEQALRDFWLCILLQEGQHAAAVEAALEQIDHFPPALLDEVLSVLLDASLKVLPFYAAASLTELAERILGVLTAHCGPDWEAVSAGERRLRLARAREILTAGAIFR